MRVTFQSLNDNVASVHAAAARLDRAQDQVATGRRLRAASDDPAAAQRAVGSRAELGTLDAYKRTSDSATARLTAIDTALSDIIDKISSAKVAAASGRGSTATPAAREAAALQIEGLRDAILSDINLSVHGAAVFAGGQSRASAYTQVGGVWTYGGDNAPVVVDIDRTKTVRTSLDGQAIIQGGDATDLFTALDELAAALRAGDEAGITAGTEALDRAFERATRVQGQVGADIRTTEDGQLQLSALTRASRTRLSKDEDADTVQAISDMNRADVAYRAALGVVGTAGRISLMDYLR